MDEGRVKGMKNRDYPIRTTGKGVTENQRGRQQQNGACLVGKSCCNTKQIEFPMDKAMLRHPEITAFQETFGQMKSNIHGYCTIPKFTGGVLQQGGNRAVVRPGNIKPIATVSSVDEPAELNSPRKKQKTEVSETATKIKNPEAWYNIANRSFTSTTNKKSSTNAITANTSWSCKKVPVEKPKCETLTSDNEEKVKYRKELIARAEQMIKRKRERERQQEEAEKTLWMPFRKRLESRGINLNPVSTNFEQRNSRRWWRRRTRVPWFIEQSVIMETFEEMVFPDPSQSEHRKEYSRCFSSHRYSFNFPDMD